MSHSAMAGIHLHWLFERGGCGETRHGSASWVDDTLTLNEPFGEVGKRSRFAWTLHWMPPPMLHESREGLVEHRKSKDGATVEDIP